MDTSFHIAAVNRAVVDPTQAAGAIAVAHAATSTGVAAATNHASGSLSPTTHPVLPSIPPMQYAKPFLDASKIELFDGNNFKRWQEQVYSILDVHGVVYELSESKPNEASVDAKLVDHWTYANKVCRHMIINTLSNELFDVYCPYKEVKKIWEFMNVKYTTKDVGKQKFVIGKFYRWEMVDDKEIKCQINEYYKLLEDLKAEKIVLQEEFAAGLLIEKLLESWNNYKNQLKHKHKQLSLEDLVIHIIIEETNRKELQSAMAKEMAHKALGTRLGQLLFCC
ncbi:uncharacterized protein LOC127804643 isoform X1 [Diospyros lotus]|uniref:uncharacterized protein LOC127804643 isoform X1 n=1 Tax=Diospyros lotus TaxID=55363 RepID=UPI002255D0C9|nr:uncharacterized protein LOC127804643 isoform X1 [Diospyros lotus]